MQPTSGVVFTAMRSAGCTVVYSAKRGKSRAGDNRGGMIRRFGLRQPAEGIPTEVELKQGELRPQKAAAAPSASSPLGKRQTVAGITTEVDIKGEPKAPKGPSSDRKSMQVSLDEIGVLAGNLLMNAASWRVVRGQTYCLQCRGTGKETCSTCMRSGIMEPEKVRMNQIRHTASKLQQLLGVSDAKMHDSDWMKSNRCKRCRGTGALPCKRCNGTGMLGPGGSGPGN